MHTTQPIKMILITNFVQDITVLASILTKNLFISNNQNKAK